MTNPINDRGAHPGLIALAWLWVARPFAYGIWELLEKVTQLFNS
jgi:hypothetical protein